LLKKQQHKPRKMALRPIWNDRLGAKREGERLAYWLNEPATPERERISELWMRIQSMVKEAGPDPNAPSQMRAVEHVNQIFERYVSRPGVLMFSNAIGWAIGYSPVAEMNQLEWQAARCVIHLAEHSLLDRIRRCEHCSRWFYARVSHKCYCSTKCQQDHFRANPKFKAKRKKYALKYYHEVLSPKSARRRKPAKGKR
jgi:hypothetical protein